MSDLNRYQNVPISEETRKGMSLNINDLGAIGRMLTLQDDVYDDQFKDIKLLFSSQNIAIMAVLETLKTIKEDIRSVKEDIKGVKTDIANLEVKVGEVTTQVKNVQTNVDQLAKDVCTLKKQNNISAYTTRISIGVLIALGLSVLAVRLFHGSF